MTVRRARGLKSMDLNGKNDPYVKLRLGTQSKETRVRMKTNDPVWDERFVFGVHSVEAQQLHVSVCDYDTFKRDDHVGSCKIGLSHLPCHSSEEAVAAAFGGEGTPLGEEDGSGHGNSCFDFGGGTEGGRGGGERAPFPMDHETRSEVGASATIRRRASEDVGMMTVARSRQGSGAKLRTFSSARDAVAWFSKVWQGGGCSHSRACCCRWNIDLVCLQSRDVGGRGGARKVMLSSCFFCFAFRAA